MAKVSRGKDFEQKIFEAFKKIPNFTIDRLPDPMSGFAGVRNICDYFGYKYPNAYYIECKSCYGKSFPMSNITDNQWKGLLEKSDTYGTVCGYFIWFIDYDKTIFVDAKSLAEYFILEDRKSINIEKLENLKYTEIKGTKKRIFFEYDLTDFVN